MIWAHRFGLISLFQSNWIEIDSIVFGAFWFFISIYLILFFLVVVVVVVVGSNGPKPFLGLCYIEMNNNRCFGRSTPLLRFRLERRVAIGCRLINRFSIGSNQFGRPMGWNEAICMGPPISTGRNWFETIETDQFRVIAFHSVFN